MRVFYIAVLGLLLHGGAAAAQSPTGARDPDALYRQRADLAAAREAVAIWDARLRADPSSFESAWKLARAMYWLGGHDVETAQRSELERGVDAGRKAAALEPRRPEGYFWMAADMGALAESCGLRQGLKYRGDIKQALETVLKIDAAYQAGSADRALGRWYFKVPGLFGGSKKKSEEHLRKSLTYDPNSAASHYFLAETLFDLDRDAEAREELRKTIAAPINPEWEPEDREFKKLAEDRLKKK
jgi:tetratricopeptide (TPR) repeat protein